MPKNNNIKPNTRGGIGPQLVRGVEYVGDAIYIESRREEILSRWLRYGQTTAQISRGLRIYDREFVELVIRRAVSARTIPPTPIVRKAA